MPDARRPGRLFASLWGPMEGSGLFTPLRVGGYEVDGKTDRSPRRRASRQRQPSAASSRWSFRSATASPTRPASGKSPADCMSRTPGRTHTSASRRSASQTSPSYGPGARTSASRSGARERRPPLAPLAPCHSLTLAHQPVLRVMLQTRWSAEAWSRVRVEFRKALALRSQIRRAGWFN
jgi:hypothetical protein